MLFFVNRLMRVPSTFYTVNFNRTTLFPTHLGGFSVRLDVYVTFLKSTMDPDFLTDEILRAIILRESGSLLQQVTLLRMHEHRLAHGIPIPGGGRRPRGVSAIRVEMTRQLIVFILCSPGVLSFTRAMGERLSSGAVITACTITEFRSVFVWGMRRASDPSVFIRTSPDGNKCVVILSCRKVTCEVLKMSPDQLERFCNIAYPPEDPQPRVVIGTGPGSDSISITFRRMGRREFGPLGEPGMTDRCTCGKHKSKTDAPPPKKDASNHAKRHKGVEYRGKVGESYASWEGTRRQANMEALGCVTRSGIVYRGAISGRVNLFLLPPPPLLSFLQFYPNCFSYLPVFQSSNLTIVQSYNSPILQFSHRTTRG
jgi:hypothetical protein